MPRAPIVLAGTVAGVVGVLTYNTSSSPSAIVGSTATTAQAAATQSTTTASTRQARSTASKRSAATSSTKTTPAASKTATAASTIRTATGQDVSFRYGDVQVKVTRSGSRITDVSIVRFDITDGHSQQIDEIAVPQLRQEALSAQSAHIDGVSGASYTSAAYAQSLQSALDKLA